MPCTVLAAGVVGPAIDESIVVAIGVTFQIVAAGLAAQSCARIEVVLIGTPVDTVVVAIVVAILVAHLVVHARTIFFLL